ncbi:hypothetical protein SAMN04487970_10568 [Paenibacillus tianmuensis]|uniref:Uncharacterized protein n=1 Tax=Paenibacillus tianmuensis TaxID=624147 RepID=A0A1G4TKF1_9BACL|nr:hypothetical protein SAMN04487970_10568 [Paenibacillus tianmuensis]
MDGTALLGMYKGQIHVEMNFSFLKDPVHTDEIYLKKPERVKVLGYFVFASLNDLPGIPVAGSAAHHRAKADARSRRAHFAKTHGCGDLSTL